MSSRVHAIDFNPAINLILNQMLHKAEYVTSRMKPLSGPLSRQSHAVLHRFLSGVICPADADLPSGPEPLFAFRRP